METISKPEGCYTDSHTLNIRTGDASKEQTLEAFRAAIASAQEKLGTSFPYRLIINMPCSASGEPLGFCYIYVTEPAIYQMALGIDSNGEPLAEKIFTMPTFQGSNGDIIFDINPCFVWDPKPQLSRNILKSSGLPSWMSEEDLKKVFSPFSSNPAYPTVRIISINKPSGRGNRRVENVAFITFDPNTREGQFALNMRKKFEIADESGKRFLFFDLAHQADIRRFPPN